MSVRVEAANKSHHGNGKQCRTSFAPGTLVFSVLTTAQIPAEFEKAFDAFISIETEGRYSGYQPKTSCNVTCDPIHAYRVPPPLLRQHKLDHRIASHSKVGNHAAHYPWTLREWGRRRTTSHNEKSGTNSTSLTASTMQGQRTATMPHGLTDMSQHPE